MELADGVYQFTLEIEYPERTFVVHPSGVALPDGGLLLVDAGPAGATDHLAAALDEHGFAIEDVEYLLLTHQDGDHVGGAPAVVERADPTVFAHGADAPAIEGVRDPIKSDGDRYDPVAVDVRIVDGVSLRTAAGPVQVVATPGHTPGHVSLFLPDASLLLAADATAAEDGELTGPKPHFTPDMDRAMTSLDDLSALAFDEVLCYHGGFAVAGPDALDALVDDYESDD